ncbi:unnamed protein product [Adineta ricciae]|uniref:MACPF-like domain-containing protein n=2 Tax=Adineta ricciae TaxID=249248 RepID=A0A814TBB5_ADIRI|nr:unnamed protein product [Adineta ricciae]
MAVNNSTTDNQKVRKALRRQTESDELVPLPKLSDESTDRKQFSNSSNYELLSSKTQEKPAVFNTTVGNVIPNDDVNRPKAQSLTKMQSQYIVQVCNLNRAMFIDGEKPKHSFETVIQMKDDVKLKALDFDIMSFDAHVTYTERASAYVENKLTGADLSLSCPFIAAPVEGEKSKKNASTSRKKQVYITCTWDCPRMRVKIDEDRFEPTRIFLNEVDRILGLPIEEQYGQFEKLHTKYGHKIATEVVIGGQLFHTDVKNQDSVVDVSSHKNNLKAAFSASITKVPITDELGMTVKGGIGGGKLSENRSHNENDIQMMHFTFRATGGDTVLCQEPGKWIATVPEYHNWRVIAIEKLEPLYKVLDDERQRKIELALQHYNTVKLASERSLNDSCDIVKLEITLIADDRLVFRQIYQLLSTTFPLVVSQTNEIHTGTDFLKGTKLCYYGTAPRILSFIETMDVSTDCPRMILDIFLPHWKDLSDATIELIHRTLKFENTKIDTNIHISSYKQVLTKNNDTFYIESELQDEKAMQNVWKLLKQLDTLTTMINDHTIDFFHDLNVLAVALKTNTTVETLNLSSWILREEQVTALAQSVEVNKTLKNLQICLGWHKNNEHLLAITKMLKNNRTLTALGLRVCCEKQVYGIMEGLKLNITLKQLSFKIFYTKNVMLEKLCESLKTNTSLENLSFYRSGIDDYTIKILVQFLKTNGTLKRLTIRVSRITDIGVQLLFDALKINETLAILDISHNKRMMNFTFTIPRDGIQILCEPWLPPSKRPNKNNHIEEIRFFAACHRSSH